MKQKKELSIKLQKETMLKKYGYETNNERPEFKDLCKRTNLKKYGYDWSAQNKNIHQKTKNTCKKKHGVEFPLQNKEINTQSKKTSLERYGVENPMQNPEIWSKAVKTNLKNANGLRNWRHISEESKKILLDKNVFSKELQISSIKELSKKLKVSPNFILTMHNKYKLNIVKSGISSYENEIKSWLCEDKINFKFKDRQEIKPKELDFYLPEYKFAIEFQGDYWHMNPKIYNENTINSVSKKTAKQMWDRDKLKEHLCKENGIELIIVWESDWNLNKEEIKKQIKEKLGVM
jgi:G:T-mismatch repair DNA endonuclease (very short patch repair protein)